jgi:hypothetical protein
MTEASSAAPRTRKASPVKYEVYRVGQGTLQFVGPAEAVNDIKAITEALGEAPQPGKYVAIALHNLRVREVGTETHVKVVIK